MSVSPPALELAERVLSGDIRAGARLMRLCDDRAAIAGEALGEVYRRSRPARLIGITGTAGAGKSTLIDRLIAYHRERGERVGVVAIDPSSPKSGGAILGDRLRMQAHALDEGVFVRSLASRGHLGGLSVSTASTIAVLEGLGFERVIVETVGIGQAEVDVARIAETTAVVLAPGLGDDIQALKAGLMEIADLFVVNKADREGADRTAADVASIVALETLSPGMWTRPILKASAARGEGIVEIVESMEQHRGWLESTGFISERRRARARLWLETVILAELRRQMLERVGGEAALDLAAERLADRTSDPDTECERLLEPRE